MHTYLNSVFIKRGDSIYAYLFNCEFFIHDVIILFSLFACRVWFCAFVTCKTVEAAKRTTDEMHKVLGVNLLIIRQLVLTVCLFLFCCSIHDDSLEKGISQST